MNYEELVQWCRYFWNPQDRTCGCGLWAAGAALEDNGQRCPVLDYGDPSFVPEPIRGNPLNKDVIFLASNPGYGGGTQVELGTCPWWNQDAEAAGGNWAAVLATEQTFAEHHLGANVRAAENKCARRGYEDDRPARAAARVLWSLEHPENDHNWPLPRVDEQAFLEVIGQVALLNVAHCKSNGFVGGDVVYNNCGAHTWSLIGMLKPRAVVAFGGPARQLFGRNSNENNVVEGSHRDHTWPEDGVTRFFWEHHPSQGWTYQARNSLVERLREFLALG